MPRIHGDTDPGLIPCNNLTSTHVSIITDLPRNVSERSRFLFLLLFIAAPRPLASASASSP